ncbi:bitter taste receptor Modo-T2R3J [Monodelphis domestica]|uniref:Taste receptor type 2 n=1 Tax=Monodelphis domestica TaxID=13616 RepID=Q2ABA2_MONDO|nr:bitter taste receptor Modo-T2R3J [Monodelphis domestica]BAE80365.1 bitter taste receptor [Monodelphis domestica]
MMNLAKIVYLVLFIIEFILGFCCNSFIGLVNCINCIKSKRMTSSDLIITSLALSRICLLWVPIVNILQLLYPNLYEKKILGIIVIIWIFINHLSTGLVTGLSVHYCLKIARYSHSAFLWLKWRVSCVVIWILLGSVLFSFFSVAPVIKELIVSFSSRQMKFIANCTENITKSYAFIFSAVWMVIPFVIILCSSLLLILSLRRHTQQMNNSITGSRDPNTEAHLKAARIIVSFLFLYILYFVAFFILIFSDYLPDYNLALMIGEMITTAYPSAHSFILILSNNKLKQAFLRMFQIRCGTWGDLVTLCLTGKSGKQ